MSGNRYKTFNLRRSVLLEHAFELHMRVFCDSKSFCTSLCVKCTPVVTLFSLKTSLRKVFYWSLLIAVIRKPANRPDGKKCQALKDAKDLSCKKFH